MTDITKRVQAFKKATRNLRDTQEDLRLARAEYNKARDALTDDSES
jgi:F0F1-type ATP synthase gamma subunit